MKILWIDDQLDVAKTFAKSLQYLGYVIEFASNGEEALDKLKEQNFDILLTDLAMPPGQWGGLWMLEQLKNLPETFPNPPPVIVVSGEGSQKETIKALRLGARDYVTKETIFEELPQQLLTLVKENSRKTNDIKSIIAVGETSEIEFKSTLRFNLKSNKNDTNIEQASLKTIAAFLNTNGGRLIIGVNDQGEILGLEHDNFKTLDNLQIHFWNLFRNSIGTEFSEFIKSAIINVDNKNVFSIICRASTKPVYLKWKESGESNYQEIFYIRAGPQTERLSTRQIVSYINDHY